LAVAAIGFSRRRRCVAVGELHDEKPDLLADERELLARTIGSLQPSCSMIL